MQIDQILTSKPRRKNVTAPGDKESQAQSKANGSSDEVAVPEDPKLTNVQEVSAEKRMDAAEPKVKKANPKKGANDVVNKQNQSAEGSTQSTIGSSEKKLLVSKSKAAALKRSAKALDSIPVKTGVTA